MNEAHAIKLKKLFVQTSGDFLGKNRIFRRYAANYHTLAQFYVSSLFRAYFCFATGKQPLDIGMMAGPDKTAKQ